MINKIRFKYLKTIKNSRFSSTGTVFLIKAASSSLAPLYSLFIFLAASPFLIYAVNNVDVGDILNGAQLQHNLHHLKCLIRFFPVPCPEMFNELTVYRDSSGHIVFPTEFTPSLNNGEANDFLLELGRIILESYVNVFLAISAHLTNPDIATVMEEIQTLKSLQSDVYFFVFFDLLQMDMEPELWQNKTAQELRTLYLTTYHSMDLAQVNQNVDGYRVHILMEFLEKISILYEVDNTTIEHFLVGCETNPSIHQELQKIFNWAKCIDVTSVEIDIENSNQS